MKTSTVKRFLSAAYSRSYRAVSDALNHVKDGTKPFLHRLGRAIAGAAVVYTVAALVAAVVSTVAVLSPFYLLYLAVRPEAEDLYNKQV